MDHPDIKKIYRHLEEEYTPIDMFIPLCEPFEDEIENSFEHFLHSPFYKFMIQCKYIERSPVVIADFNLSAKLGQGSFGVVYSCMKNDTGAK